MTIGGILRLCLMAALSLSAAPGLGADVLRVGSQQAFPPVEFLDAETGEPRGASVDLLTEIARRLDLEIAYEHGSYATLISGLDANRFDIASGGISDTAERELQADFVNYMQSGASILIRPADAERFRTIDDFCGHAVATLMGSNVIETALVAASVRCVDAGKPKITVQMLPTSPEARLQLDLGRVDGYISDFIALVFLNNQSVKPYAIAGSNYLLTRYVTSWAFRKDDPMLERVRETADAMLADGTYLDILTRWGLEGGALKKITINTPVAAQ